MDEPSSETEITIQQSKFSDYMMASMLLSIAGVFIVTSLFEFVLTTRRFKKGSNLIFLLTLIVIALNAFIKVFEFCVLYPGKRT